MENHFVVSANGPWYDLFYNLAFLVTLGIMLFEGYRRKLPLLKWIFFLAVTRFFFIVGTKIVTISSHDWYLLLTQFSLPEAQEKSLAGGLLFGGIALVGGAYLLRFKQNISDAFALALPLGFVIQRFGCFVTGCCFGKVCNLPWAVQYPVQTLPHFHQFNDKLLTYNDIFSLPVHPVQLYEIAGILAVFFVLLKMERSFKRAGSLFLFSLILISIVRFTVEFFRDAHAHTIGGRMVGVFNATQLFILPLVLLLIFVLWRMEEQPARQVIVPSSNDFGIVKAFFLLLILSTLFRSLKNWFVFSEVVALTVTFLAAYILLGYRIIAQLYFSQYRWFYLASFVLPFFLMAQTFPYGSDSLTIKKYKSIKIGMATGDYENSYDIGHGQGCDRVSQTEYFKQKYTLGAAALEFSEENISLKTQTHYGVKAMLGRQREIRISDQFEKNKTLFGLTPYVNWDSNWLGVGGGLHVGNLSYIYENLESDGDGYPGSGSKTTFIYPQIYFRVGPQKWFFVDYHLADYFPSALPGFRHQLGIGTGLGLTNGTNLRFGSSFNMTYASGTFVINKRIVLEPMILWGPDPNYDEYNKYHQFSMGIGYRFGFSETKKSIF